MMPRAPSTPCPVLDLDALRRNLALMAAAHPGRRLRPHIKAHKCTSLAREQMLVGHRSFTCATPREILGLVAAGVGDDLLLANESVDPERLGLLARAQESARITVAVDSEATIAAAARAGIGHVLIDVNVGLPRCGCRPDDAGRLADLSRARGLEVRGVMGYEGHLMMVPDRDERRRRVHESMETLGRAHHDVGGEIVSAGGTGTWDMFDGTAVNEVQAGSYALMDTHYAGIGLPFEQALVIEGTVISVNDTWAVADVGLKALGMDHGNPAIAGHKVWFCSDEHITFSPGEDGSIPEVGDAVAVVPAHIDPTLAMHERMLVVSDGEIVDEWPIDLRGW